MSVLVQADSVSEAWVKTLGAARQTRNGRRPHVIAGVGTPGREILDMKDLLDKVLAEFGCQSIDTVAETIFPSSLYEDPGYDWEPGLSTVEEERLDEAARSLYEAYFDILPSLRTVGANKSGTYFSRMITWPGKEVGGTNQLQLRIERLRTEARNARRTNNTLDIDIAADALEGTLPGVQVYAVEDRRTRGFPCLTHVDLTLLENKLHCTAVYRHQYLIEKAYGNLLGLSALLRFLCQQGGCVPGELVVHATLADAQQGKFGRSIDPLETAALDLLSKSMEDKCGNSRTASS